MLFNMLHEAAAQLVHKSGGLEHVAFVFCNFAINIPKHFNCKILQIMIIQEYSFQS